VRIPGVDRLVAVASGKGGVGKSTTAVNLAAAMSTSGLRVGLVDADVYGPDIPVMMGVRSRPTLDGEGKLVPEKAYGVKLMSLGLLMDAGVPVIWRGPMLSKVVSQFLVDVAWGPLDCLLVDLPPGTGDVQLTLTQSVAVDGAVIVTTPQALALEDVQRGVRMFKEVDVRVLGIVENMSAYVCPRCGAHADVFGSGGGQSTAERFGVPFLGGIPLNPEIRTAADSGSPVSLLSPDSTSAQAYRQVAERVMEAVAA